MPSLTGQHVQAVPCMGRRQQQRAGQEGDSLERERELWSAGINVLGALRLVEGPTEDVLGLLLAVREPLARMALQALVCSALVCSAGFDTFPGISLPHAITYWKGLTCRSRVEV